MFAMLLPTILPTESPEAPFNAAPTLTTSSGAEVPKATTVKPITRGETFNLSARATEPLTRNSAPPNRRINPKIT